MSGENEKSISVPAKDGHAIHTLSVGMDKSEKKAIIIISHGFSEHSGSYLEISQELCSAGFACLVPDQRGHGVPPEGIKKWHGIIPNYQSFIDDIAAVTNTARELSPGIPIALYGHSMGGGIVLNTLLRMSKEQQAQYLCAVVEAPWLGLYEEFSPLTRGLLGMLSIIVPKARMKRPPSNENLSSDSERAKGITEDEFYHGYLSFHMLKEIMDACDYAMENVQQLSVPTLLALAEKEVVVNNDAMREFAKKAGEIVTLKEYDSLHAIHNDDKRDIFCKDMIDFIDSHLLK
ncbi:MAG: lysophospholipase [Oscillospiraceae bacterium]|nr:lysophospholipase [Oscillospiraceae bacterium]MCL2277987.1 lysophospholipase [Oscillospiraceae bacterium]